MTTLLDKFKENVKRSPGWVVFPDAYDPRAIRAALNIQEERLGFPWLLGECDKIEAICQKEKLSFDSLNIINPEKSEWIGEFAERLVGRVKGKNVSELEEMVKDPLWFGASMLATQRCDYCIAGNISSTSDVLRAGLRVLGLKPGNKTLSSIMLMISPDGKNTYAFSDCAVIPEPTKEQLADIAVITAENYQAITENKAHVAMLSFSTKGSAKHDAVTRVQEATALVKAHSPDLDVDGDLQFDAAIVPSVGKQKAPDSKVAGNANVLIFPSLEAGNIGYKIAQRFGGYEAIGPLIQGLNGQFHDLSRGCSWQDMVQVLLLASQIEKGSKS